MSDRATVKDLHALAAETPTPRLCCTPPSRWTLPELVVPKRMEDMDGSQGTTVHPRDLADSPTVLCVGIGGGLEILQFAYFSRRRGAVIGVDPVEGMRAAARENLREAARVNRWFREEFAELRDGEALALPLEDGAVDVAAQNGRFNAYDEADLKKALAELHRVLKQNGRLVISGPVAPAPLPAHLSKDERLRAMCLSGVTTYERYVAMLVEAGFGTIEVRARRPYRVLDPTRFGTKASILLESLEVAAIKDEIPADGPCVFTGRTAIYFGDEASFGDRAGHVMTRDLPLSVCDKTAAKLERLGRTDLIVTPSTYFFDGERF